MSAIFSADHPYGGTVSINDYSDLCLDDLKDFYRNNYNLGNCNIIVSG